MENLKESADWPLVPLSNAKGGAQPLGGTMQAMPALQKQVIVICLNISHYLLGES